MNRLVRSRMPGGVGGARSIVIPVLFRQLNCVGVETTE